LRKNKHPGKASRYRKSKIFGGDLETSNEHMQDKDSEKNGDMSKLEMTDEDIKIGEYILSDKLHDRRYKEFDNIKSKMAKTSYTMEMIQEELIDLYLSVKIRKNENKTGSLSIGVILSDPAVMEKPFATSHQIDGSWLLAKCVGCQRPTPVSGQLTLAEQGSRSIDGGLIIKAEAR